MVRDWEDGGWSKMANDVLEALAKIRIPGQSRQVFDAVQRMTWGFQKREDTISLGQLANYTGLSRQDVLRARKQLVNMKILIIEKGEVYAKKPTPVGKKAYTHACKYRINRHFERWKPLLIVKRGVGKKAYKVYAKKPTGCRQYCDLPKTSNKDIDPKKEYKKEDLPFEEIISDLNQVLGRTGHRQWKLNETTKGNIRARFKEGYILEDFKHVHRVKQAEWTGTDYEKYLRPITLYNASKFPGYVMQETVIRDTKNDLPQCF